MPISAGYPTATSTFTPEPSEFMNIGPLTQLFTPPPECSTLKLYQDWDRRISVQFGCPCRQGLAYQGNNFYALATRCYPGAFADIVNARHSPRTVPFYSPAFECPLGYTSACGYDRLSNGMQLSEQLWVDVGAKTKWRDVLGDSGMAIGCCPSGYSCIASNVASCASKVFPDIPITVVSYDGQDCSSSTITTSFKTGVDESPFPRDGSFWDMAIAQRIILVHAEPFLAMQTSKVEKASTTRQSMTHQDRIAIGVSIPVAIVLALTAAWFLVRHRRISRKRLSNAPSERECHSQKADGMAELGSDSATPALGRAAPPAVVELSGTEIRPHGAGRDVRSSLMSELSAEPSSPAPLPLAFESSTEPQPRSG